MAEKDGVSKIELPLCMWRMRTQFKKDGNTYVMLVFDPRASSRFKGLMFDMESGIDSPRAAVCGTFGLTNPVEVMIVPPKPSWASFLRQLNPIDLLNPKMLPQSSILPNRSDPRVCLCLQVDEEHTELGAIQKVGGIEDGGMGHSRRVVKISRASVDAGWLVQLYRDTCTAYVQDRSCKDCLDALEALRSKLSPTDI